MTKADDEANEKYVEKVMTSGTWIDKKFLEELLFSNIGKNVIVLNHEVQPAVGAGDNYLSILYKTSVTYTLDGSDEEQTIYLMIKGEPTAELFIQFIEEMGIFIKEMTMYYECLPVLHKHQKDHFPEGTPFVAPESYKCLRKNTLVMEDLGKQGYKMANRRNQLDFEHSAATLETLARFHALSVKVHGEDPELIKSVTEEFYRADNKEKMGQYLVDGLNLVADVHEKIEENIQFAKTLRELANHAWEKIIKLVEPTKKLNVLNHGDLWTNNILFKYNEDGSILNAKMVDFQLSRYGSPVLDLHYFLLTSLQPKVLKEKMTELLRVYHDTLIKSFNALGLDHDYSFDDLQEDMREKAAFGVISIVQILPVTIAAPSDNLNLDDVNVDDIKTGAENPMKSKYESPVYVKISGEYFSYLESIGYLSDAIERLQPFVDELENKKKSELS